MTFANGEVFSQTFWQPNEPRDLKIGLGRPCSETALSKLVAEQIETSIKQQMDVDVPFGAFLSGGLDSSTIVALMTKLSIKPIDTFSIGFEDQASDETMYARQVAEFLNTNHHELKVTSDDFFTEIVNLPDIYDEPFSDPSQLPTVLLAKFAREKVKVALTGDGGDETFLGYSRYKKVERLWRLKAKFPKIFDRLLGSLAANIYSACVKCDGLLKQRYLMKLEKLEWLARCQSITEFYAIYTSFWVGQNVTPTIQGHSSNRWPNIDDFKYFNSGPKTNALLANLDYATYLPDCPW